MEVIFIKDLKNQGKKGEIKEVKDGYAKNFLIKNGYAVMKNETSLKELKRNLNNEKKLDEENRIKANKLKESLEKETYKFIEKWKGKVTIHSHPFDPLPGSKWQYETPTEVPEKLIKAVRSLEGIGRVFGRVVKDKEKVCRI